MTKQQENRAFAKMLKEFPKAFGRVSFRERLMLRTAFTYVVEEVIADIKANCDLAIEGRDIKIKELEKENERLKGDLELWESGGFRATKLFECGVVKELKEQIEKMKCCGNCRFDYCERSSECIDKDGNRTFHCWNEEKERYCDVGKNGKYQCWELDD